MLYYSDMSCVIMLWLSRGLQVYYSTHVQPKGKLDTNCVMGKQSYVTFWTLSWPFCFVAQKTIVVFLIYFILYVKPMIHINALFDICLNGKLCRFFLQKSKLWTHLQPTKHLCFGVYRNLVTMFNLARSHRSSFPTIVHQNSDIFAFTPKSPLN